MASRRKTPPTPKGLVFERVGCTLPTRTSVDLARLTILGSVCGFDLGGDPGSGLGFVVFHVLILHGLSVITKAETPLAPKGLKA